MKKKNTLKVKPLRRYKTPIYPSYLDKNPIEHPDTLPYPFSYKALQVLAGAGILVGVSCSPTKSPSGDEPITQDSLVNPFSFKKLDIPFMPAMFGTGMPSRLKSEEARETINKVFQEEGIELEADYAYKRDGINIKLDGYDTERKIGYVWLNYKNQGRGIVKDWGNSSYDEAKAKILEPTSSRYYRYDDLEYLKSYVARFIGNEMSWDIIEEYSDKFNEIDDLANEEKKLVAYKELHLDMLIEKAQNEESLAFPIQKISKNSNYEQKKTVYINWILKGKFEKRTEKIPHKETLYKILDSILEIEDESLKEKRYDDLVNFVSPSRYWVDDSTPDNSRFTEDIEQMKKNIRDYMGGLSDEKIALREAQKIDSLPKISGDFIAPIGIRDRTFSYYHSLPILTREEEEKIEKIRLTGDKEELLSVSDEILKVANKRKPQDQALKALETQVRQYIQWAKQQGGS